MSAELIVLVGVAILLSAIAAAVWRRSSDGSNGGSDVHGRALVPSEHGDEAVVQADELMLVPLPTRLNEALVVGSDQALSVLDASGLSRRTPGGELGPLPQLVRRGLTVGGGEATRRAQGGVDAGRIVALSEETMRELQKKGSRPVYDKANNMLGIVKGDKGKFQHVMRLDKAGAQAMVASNAATLAVTAALSQQLEHIEQQLNDISDMLTGLVADADRHRLAKVIAANRDLVAIADDVRRRGKMVQEDWDLLAAMNLSVTTNSTEAELKFSEILEAFDDLNRNERIEKFEVLLEKERLEYWLAFRVQSHLAHTRRDLLKLYWEHERHPDAAAQLDAQTWNSIRKRQEQLAQIGSSLDLLVDPESRTILDPLRQVSRYRLKRGQEFIDDLLSKHGDAFAGPDADPYAVIEQPQIDGPLAVTGPEAARNVIDGPAG